MQEIHYWRIYQEYAGVLAQKVKIGYMGKDEPYAERWMIDFVNKAPGKNVVKLRVVK